MAVLIPTYIRIFYYIVLAILATIPPNLRTVSHYVRYEYNKFSINPFHCTPSFLLAQQPQGPRVFFAAQIKLMGRLNFLMCSVKTQRYINFGYQILQINY